MVKMFRPPKGLRLSCTDDSALCYMSDNQVLGQVGRAQKEVNLTFNNLTFTCTGDHNGSVRFGQVNLI